MSNTKPLRKTLISLTLAGVLSANPLFVQADLGDQVLKRGMNHEDIKVLQQHLVNLNYLDLDETTTYFGDLTADAILNFQLSQGLTPDACFGTDTYEALKSIIELEPLSFSRLLYEELEGEDVKELQERLKILGFLDIDECTTYFGPQTLQAIKDFQDIYGIKISGVADEETIQSINDALNGNKRKIKPFSSRGNSINSNVGVNLINTAKKYMGTPYRSGGSTPKGFDCSGFTQYVFKQNNVQIPRTSLDQANAGILVNKADLRIGDLVIFKNTYKSGPSHTGIYIGNGSFIHSSSTNSRGVIISDLSSGYYSDHFHSGRRVF